MKQRFNVGAALLVALAGCSTSDSGGYLDDLTVDDGDAAAKSDSMIDESLDGVGSTAAAMGLTGVLTEEEFAKLHELRADTAPAALGEMIELPGGNSRAYLSRASLAATGGGPAKGAVLVIHEWWGLNDNIKHWTDRLALDGYDALAVDLYSGVVATTPEEATATMNTVDEDAALTEVRAAHAYLTSADGLGAERTACIGWCFGGGWSLRAALDLDELDGAVIYYGRLIDDPAQLAAIDARVLGIFGNQDRGIPPSSVDAFVAGLSDAKVDAEIFRYEAEHAFANPSSARYDETAAAAAWSETSRFLAEVLRR